MSFIRDMDRGSDEYAAAVDQVLVHCRDSEFGIRAAGELLQAKMYNPSAAPIEPSIAASETFTNFINALENEASIRIVFVVHVAAFATSDRKVRIADSLMGAVSHP